MTSAGGEGAGGSPFFILPLSMLFFFPYNEFLVVTRKSALKALRATV